MKAICALCLLAIASCGTKKDKVVTDPTTLQGKVDAYESLMLSTADKDGFLDTYNCDSLMNTSLGNDRANIFAAEVAPGKWMRRPPSYPDCYSTGASASDISRDMLLGVIYRCTTNGDLGCLKRMWDYGTAHSWSMGVHGWEHSVFTPDYIALLAQAIYKVSGGKSDYVARVFKFPTLTPAVGFEAQLQAIFMVVREKVYGESTVDNYLLGKLAAQNTDNPLMQYVGGNFDAAKDLLMNDWPEGRLPTSSDWCTDWLLSEAPDGNGRVACPEQGHTHSGGDLLFVAKLILE